jgi:hypothetical protein
MKEKHQEKRRMKIRKRVSRIRTRRRRRKRTTITTRERTTVNVSRHVVRSEDALLGHDLRPRKRDRMTRNAGNLAH